MDSDKYSKFQNYRVIRQPLYGAGLTLSYIPVGEEGITHKTLEYEVIHINGVRHLCARDNVEYIIYIDTHAMEGRYEGSSRRREDQGSGDGGKGESPDDSDQDRADGAGQDDEAVLHGERDISDGVQEGNESPWSKSGRHY